MIFDRALLETYRALLQTTDLQRSYQEFVRLFRWLHTELQRRLPDFRFQGGICENAMEYAYFSFSSPELRKEGLKLVAVFVHSDFRLEVWLSGVNRAAQCRWARRLPPCPPPVEAAADPARRDWLARLPVETDLSDGTAAATAMEAAVRELLRFFAAAGRAGEF